MKITIVYYDGEKTVRETRGGRNNSITNIN